MNQEQKKQKALQQSKQQVLNAKYDLAVINESLQVYLEIKLRERGKL